MTDENRQRLTALVAAGTKLEAAARLVKEAIRDVDSSGLLPLEYVQKIADDIDAYGQRVTSAIRMIPGWASCTSCTPVSDNKSEP